MDREAFRNRMQQLKQYREQNPGKTYLDWKNSLPSNLQDESNYNLRRAYELGYEPEWNEDDKSYHLPTRDSETGEILKKPWHPTFLIGLQEDAKLGYYPQIKNGTMYTTTWEGNENPIYKYADGGEIPPNNKPIIPEQPQLYKGKLYKDRYGRKYTEDQLADYYDNSSDEIDRFTGKPFIRGLKPMVDIEDAANVTPIGDAISIYDTYEALRNKDWGNAGLAALGLVPFMPRFGGVAVKSSKKISKPKSTYIPKVDPNYNMYNNILQGTEIKSYMNQFRNYLDQKGKLNRGNYTGSYKNLKKEIIDAPRESFNNIKAIFNLYRSPKLFNKDFQMIPIVNNNDNNTIV